MKNTVIITAAFAALLSMAACERETADAQLSGEGLRINLTCEDIGTRSDGTTQPGVGNENLLRTVDVFLFNTQGTETEFKHHWRFSPEIESNFTCFIQSALIVDGIYSIYSIVNYPGQETDFVVSGVNATRGQLEALTLSESVQHTFTADGSAGGLAPAPNADLSLVMTGLAENISIASTAGQTLVGEAEISLTRLPAKVTMDFYLKDQVVNTKGNVTETWTPLTEGNNIRVYLCNGASEALVGSEDPDPALFDYEPNLDNTTIEGKTGYSTAFSSAAFYTYPESWAYGASTEPYLKLIVPWKLSRSVGGNTQESQKEFYYKVMLPTSAFESNNWYHLILDVTQLGGNADDDAVNIPCGYQVVDWKSGSEITSTMSPGYYLDVNVPDLDDIKFYGDELDITYFASGAVTLRSVVKEWENYKTGEHKEERDNTGVSKATDGDFIHIDNPLDYDFDSNEYDVSPYKYTIVIGLADDLSLSGEYNKTLTVTQYPPLYITNTDTSKNAQGGNLTNTSASVYVNGRTYSSSGSGYNQVTVYDNSGTGLDNTLGSVAPRLTAVPLPVQLDNVNQNPNIYEVTTTILKFNPTVEGNSFETVLGDPRGAAVNYDGTNGHAKLSGTSNNNPGLTNYRPAAEDTQNVISPRFISASSYGKTASTTYEGAVKRCASYQEYGYPAGRWRLPTKAEILFLQKLNKDNKIPKLFAPDLSGSVTRGYWAAGQLLYVYSNGNSGDDSFVSLAGATAVDGLTGNNLNIGIGYRNVGGKNYAGYVRCVYDTWYWGESPFGATTNSWLGFQTGTN